ncbi:hypothetical protein HD554DRAFT_2171380 [Boletus coccyginus]|nr:hypothetical protein HD554DRAFT_2171380 [Boletus coccyginus]
MNSPHSTSDTCSTAGVVDKDEVASGVSVDQYLANCRRSLCQWESVYDRASRFRLFQLRTPPLLALSDLEREPQYRAADLFVREKSNEERGLDESQAIRRRLQSFLWEALQRTPQPPALARSSPSLDTRRYFLGSGGLTAETNASCNSVDRHFAPEEDIGDAGPRFPLDSLVEAQYSSHESASAPIHPFYFPSSSDPTSTSTTFRLTHHPCPHDTPSVIDAMAKDPEALKLDTQSFNVADATRSDPSIMVTALITALGLLTSQPSNPKVVALQLSAAAISLTLIALHSFHSNTLAGTEQRSRELTFGQQLLKYFPRLIFGCCWLLFLLSVTLTSPKIMTVTISLVVFASIPMACGARLPAALTLVVVGLFSLTFFALVFLVCILPTEWLE